MNNIAKDIKYRAETEFKLTLIFSIIGMVLNVIYSISFIAIGANVAAFIQLMGAFVFMSVVGLLRRRMIFLTRYIILSATLILIFVQTVFIFGNGFGFHFLLFPLMVVIFLLLDFNVLKERICIYLFSVFTTAVFFCCEWLDFSNVLFDQSSYGAYYYAFTILVAFACMMTVLYFLSVEIFATKDQLYNMATSDSLTGLMNRRTFVQRGSEYFKIAERGGNTYSVIIFDIDDFKSVNDEYGHIVGDFVLKEIAGIAKIAVRETDILARYGGEEFAVLLPNTSHEQARVVAEKLRLLIKDHIAVIKPFKIQKTVSLGVMSFDLSIPSFNDMLDKADKAMYKSKGSGKNRTTVFDMKDPHYREKRQVNEK